MLIEQVQLKHFKSYQDTIVNLQSGLNVICGRNGSGKSNFFWSLRFALGEAYFNLTRQDRQTLIKDGETFAFVEVIFDNSDKRLPTNGEQVVIRRTISLKRDEFTVDTRSVTRTEIANLLEAAGFSSANSYYIIPQGKVTSLCRAKESERLKILKQVAGTQTYEDKKKESLQIFEETQDKKIKIDGLLQTLDKRLKQLIEEKKVLKKYIKAEEERKAIAYNLLQLELQDVEENLAVYEQQQEEEGAMDFTSTKELEQKVNELETNLRQLSLLHQSLHNEIDQLVDQINACKAEQTELNCTVTNTDDLATCQRKLATLETQLNHLMSQLKALQTSNPKDKLEIVEKQQDQLQAQYQNALKQSIVFENKKDKLAYIQQEKQNLLGSIESTTQHIQFLTNQIATSNHKVKESEYQDLVEQKRELWRLQKQKQVKYNHLQDSMNEIYHHLKKCCDDSLLMTLKHCQQISKDLNLKGYHGPLYSLFTCDEQLHTIIDVVANNSLFHHVVDTEQTAEIFMNEFKRRDLGRCTFIPLNRIHNKSITIPENAVDLKSLLIYSNQFEPIIHQLFGKSIVIEDVKDASQYPQFDCLLVDGTKIESKGAMSGGYINTLKYTLLKQLQHYEDQLAENTMDSTEIDAITVKCQQMKLELMNMPLESNELQQQLKEYTHKLNHLQTQLNTMDEYKDKQEIENNLKEIQITLNQLQQQKNQYEQQYQALEMKQEYLTMQKETILNRLKQLDQTHFQQLLITLQEKKKNYNTMKTSITQQKSELDAFKEQLVKTNTTLTHQQQEMEMVLECMATELQQKTSLLNKIKDLGVLPSMQIIQKYSKNKSELLAIEIPEILNVNKRANEQYAMYSKEQKQLLERQSTLDENALKITQLLKEMDLKKQDAIELTFSQVQEAFTTLFKVVTNGLAELTLNEDGLAITAQFGQKQLPMGSLSGSYYLYRWTKDCSSFMLYICYSKCR